MLITQISCSYIYIYHAHIYIYISEHDHDMHWPHKSNSYRRRSKYYLMNVAHNFLKSNQCEAHRSPRSRLRVVMIMKTCAVFRDKASAVSNPRPSVPPVTMKTLSVRSGASHASYVSRNGRL